MTTVLPSEVLYCHVKWQAYEAIADSSDSDVYPDQYLPTGTVTFTPKVTGLLFNGAAVPFTLLPRPIVVTLSGGGLDIYLVSTDNADGSPVFWTWAVSFALDDGIKYNSFAFAAPSGGEVDLTNVTPVTVSNGQPIIQGPKGDAATIQFLDPITGDPGTEVLQTNAGDIYGAILQFTIPRGNIGPAPTLATGTQTIVPYGTSPSYAVRSVGTGAYALDMSLQTGPTGPAGGLPVTPATYTGDMDLQLTPGAYYCDGTNLHIPPGCGEGLAEVFSSNSGNMLMQRYTDYRRGMRFERRQFSSGHAPRTQNLLTANQATEQVTGASSGVSVVNVSNASISQVSSPTLPSDISGGVSLLTCLSAGAGLADYARIDAPSSNLGLAIWPLGTYYASVYVNPSLTVGMLVIRKNNGSDPSPVTKTLSGLTASSWNRVNISVSITTNDWTDILFDVGWTIGQASTGSTVEASGRQLEFASAATPWTYPDANTDELEFAGYFSDWKVA